MSAADVAPSDGDTSPDLSASHTGRAHGGGDVTRALDISTVYTYGSPDLTTCDVVTIRLPSVALSVYNEIKVFNI